MWIAVGTVWPYFVCHSTYAACLRYFNLLIYSIWRLRTNETNVHTYTTYTQELNDCVFFNYKCNWLIVSQWDTGLELSDKGVGWQMDDHVSRRQWVLRQESCCSPEMTINTDFALLEQTTIVLLTHKHELYRTSFIRSNKISPLVIVFP